MRSRHRGQQPGERAQITDIRHRLLADHAGLSPSEVAEPSRRHRVCSPRAVFSARGHSLRRVDDGEPDPEEMARYVEGIADPERPIPIGSLLSMEMSGRKARFPAARAAKLIAALVFVLGLALAWKFTPLSQYLDSKTVEATMAGFASSPWAPALCHRRICPRRAFGVSPDPADRRHGRSAWACSRLYLCRRRQSCQRRSYVLRWRLVGRRNMESALGPRLNRIRGRVQRGGVLAITAIRLVPIAPFTIVNMVAGASGISFSHYIIGTALGLLPGTRDALRPRRPDHGHHLQSIAGWATAPRRWHSRVDLACARGSSAGHAAARCQAMTSNGPRTVRVMTWNIHGGIGPDGLHDLQRMLTVIQRANPDILALQEVDSRRLKGGEHPVSTLKRVLGHHGIAAAAITTADGDYGQVLLSRWPLDDAVVHDISVPRREPRRAIAATVRTSAGPLFVVAAHLGLSFVERRRQCGSMMAVIEQSRAGDRGAWRLQRLDVAWICSKRPRS